MMQTIPLLRSGSMWILGGALALVEPLPTVPRYDPPASPPPCNVQLDSVFCARITDIERDPGDPNRFTFMGEVLNWTNTPAAGLVITMNVANGGAGLQIGEPYFDGAFIDSNGRPIGPGSNPPSGNLNTANDWLTIALTPTQICFAAGSGGTPIPKPAATVRGTTYCGRICLADRRAPGSG